MNGVGTDSTINAQDLTLSGLSTVDGQIGDGLDFVGNTSSTATKDPFSVFPSTQISCEFWVKSGTNGEGMVSYSVGTGLSANEYLIFDQEDIGVFVDGGAVFSGFAIDDNVFHHIATQWRSSDGLVRLFVDGIQVNTDNFKTGASMENNGFFVLGQEQDNRGPPYQGNQALDGILDEVRISNNFRSADYVITSFNNQSNPGAFYATGGVEQIKFISMEYE